MKKVLTHSLAVLLLLAVAPAFGHGNYWQHLGQSAVPSKNKMAVHPTKYEVFSLQTAELQQILSKAGDSYQTGVAISLPGYDHKMEQFIAWKTPVMPPSLAAQYPQFATYTATSTSKKGVSAKISFTDQGFRAAIYHGAEIFFIDPYSNNNDGYYLAFAQKNLPLASRNFSCDINQYPNLLNPGGEPIKIGQQHHTANRQNGSVRHTYRLALACTGEYAQAATSSQNPSAQTVLGIIISTVNRINGVYERELSVSFVLVANEPDILYTNPVTDPYTCNLDENCLLGENQDVVDSLIGDANYDIGHIFCTAGGGLAALYAVCQPHLKAQGASTSGGPDDFGIPLHEMGHQFSARHTFNAETGGCQGNIDTTCSYEPGSGSTIMSYAGACPPNNIAPYSDDYFNSASLDLMSNFITTQGSQPGCGTTATGLNSVSIPSNLARTYNIPKSTPFELVSPAITPSQPNASISYTWEQHDLGNFGGTESQDGNATKGPIMRSYPPTDSSNIRQFPIANILDNTYTALGERLPAVARTVHFRLTARSILNGWGSFAIMDSTVTLKVASSGPFRVTQPMSDGVYDPGDSIRVTWDVNNVNQAPVNCHAVNVYLSLDGGQTFPILLRSNTPDTGGTTVVMPNVYTTKGYIKVQGTSNIFYDVGRGKLTINGTTGIANTSFKKATKVYPNPATNIIHLEHTGNSADLMVNMYSLAGRLVWTGKMVRTLDIPVGKLARGNYRIQVINRKTAAYASYSVSLK